MTEEAEVPQFIQPKNVLQLSNEELETEIAARQERRLAAFRVYTDLLQKQKETRNEKLKIKLGKELEQFTKAIATIDKAIEKCRERVNKIRGLRLELDDTFDIHQEDTI